MSAKPAAQSVPLLLVFGEDDFAVQQRGREVFQAWQLELGSMDHETIDARVGNSGEALAALGKLRESLNTLPFFGGGKAVWFKDCSFLGDDRTSGSAAVTESLADLADLLKAFPWGSVRLVITAGKVDRRKTFFKTLQKFGGVEEFAGWSANDWADRAEMFARQGLRERGLGIDDEALGLLVQSVGPHPRLLQMELEKLATYVGEGREITTVEVAAVCVRNKQAQAFALAEAVGDRKLPAALRILDEELWTMQFDKDKSEIGLLYGLISKVRVLLMAQELLRSGKVKPTNSTAALKSQLERLNPDDYPKDRRYNPLAIHPFVLSKALPQAKNYSTGELVRGMELLLEGNRRLVSSGSEERMILQQLLVEFIGAPRRVGRT